MERFSNNGVNMAEVAELKFILDTTMAMSLRSAKVNFAAEAVFVKTNQSVEIGDLLSRLAGRTLPMTRIELVGCPVMF